MLLINFLGIIAKLILVSSACDVGLQDVEDFDWNKVGISVLTRFLKQVVLETVTWFYILFVVPLRSS
jgi:hypothetical protein